jgi:hypothetical protein
VNRKPSVSIGVKFIVNNGISRSNILNHGIFLTFIWWIDGVLVSRVLVIFIGSLVHEPYLFTDLVFCFNSSNVVCTLIVFVYQDQRIYQLF